MPSTTNFGWTTPADTDYVKDGASAMRTLANGIDTSFVYLKGGTTGQVLSKTSGTDLAFTWVTPQVGDITSVGVTSPLTGGGTTGDVTIAIQDGTTAQKGAVQLEDSTSSTSTTKAATPNSVKTAYDLANGAIAKSLVDAKGDLILGTADNTVARQAVGTNNHILYADSTATNGVAWAAGSKATLTTKGDLLGASAANTLARIAVGTDGQVLTADSASTAGVKWSTIASSSSGLTLISTTTMSAVTTQSVNSVFSSTYRSYLIIFNLTSSSVSAGTIDLRLRASGTDASGSDYFRSGWVNYNGAVNNSYTTTTNWQFGNQLSIGKGGTICTLVAPNEAAPTIISLQATSYGDTSFNYNGVHSQSTAYDGFSLIASQGNITGTVSVYGYSK